MTGRSFLPIFFVSLLIAFGANAQSLPSKVLLETANSPFSPFIAPFSAKEQITICSNELGALRDEKGKTDFLLVRAYAFLREKQYVKCKCDCDAVLRIDPTNLAAQIFTVYCLALQEKYDEAERQLHVLLDAHPKEPRLLLYKCAFLRMRGKFEPAIEVADAGLKLAKDDLMVKGMLYDHKAGIYYAQEKFELCLLEINRAIELIPWHPGLSGSFYYTRALALEKLKRFAEAMVNYETAVHFDKTDLEAQRGKWRACLGLAQYAHAAYIAEDLVKIDPSDERHYWMSAAAHNLLGDFKGAAKVIDVALDKNSNGQNLDVDVLLPERAIAAEGLGNYKLALEFYEAGISASSISGKKSNTATYGKAFLFSSCPEKTIRDGQGAKILAQHAMDSSGQKNLGRFALAQAYAECGEFRDALAEIAKIDAKRVPRAFAGCLEQARSCYKKGQAYYEKALFNKTLDRLETD